MLHGEAFYIEFENADSTVVLSAFLFFEFNRSFVFCTYMSTKMCKCCISDMGKDARAGCFDAYFFHHPVCCTVYAEGKEGGLMVTILGERRASLSCLPQTEEPSLRLPFVCCVDL